MAKSTLKGLLSEQVTTYKSGNAYVKKSKLFWACVKKLSTSIHPNVATTIEPLVLLVKTNCATKHCLSNV